MVQTRNRYDDICVKAIHNEVSKMLHRKFKFLEGDGSSEVRHYSLCIIMFVHLLEFMEMVSL